jgi:hypothetical protein
MEILFSSDARTEENPLGPPPPAMRPTDHYASIVMQLGKQDKKKA